MVGSEASCKGMLHVRVIQLELNKTEILNLSVNMLGVVRWNESLTVLLLEN